MVGDSWSIVHICFYLIDDKSTLDQVVTWRRMFDDVDHRHIYVSLGGKGLIACRKVFIESRKHAPWAGR